MDGGDCIGTTSEVRHQSLIALSLDRKGSKLRSNSSLGLTSNSLLGDARLPTARCSPLSRAAGRERVRLQGAARDGCRRTSSPDVVG